MINISNKKITTIAMVLGILLIVSAMITVIFHHVSQNNNKENVQQIVKDIYSLIPDVENAVPEAPADITMPVMEIDGQDFAGIIEVPAYGKTLPVYAGWNKRKLSKFPCRYTGSIYDNSLIIGAVENPGQFDITKLISGGDEVLFTEMTGLRYPYIITDIYMTKDVSTENLISQKADLTLFIKSDYGSDYMLINCKLDN